MQQLLEDITAVEPASVVFNWECCSGCHQETFGEHRAVVLELMQLLLRRGHMVMCSDFSLKALVADWSEPHLGPNPFVKVGEFSGPFSLRFSPQALTACPSAQLQKVGEMCDAGRVEVHALGGTIAFAVDARRAAAAAAGAAYALEVLTVATDLRGVSVPAAVACEAGGHRGAAGHVLLRYPTGGLLLASAGHWVELTRVEVSADRLVQVAAASYGAQRAEEVQGQLTACGSAEERSWLSSRLATRYISMSSPGAYSKSASWNRNAARSMP